MNDSMRRKAELRTEIAKLRQSVTPAEIERLSLAASRELLLLPELSDSTGRTVTLYLSLPGEIDPAPAWRELSERGHRCVFPRVQRGSRILSFSPLRPGDPLASGPLGLREPLPGTEIDPEEIDVFVVPGAAFDLAGGRLGRGGGYYDATLLQTAKAVRVGLCMDEQVVEEIPMLAHDSPLDWIVTPTRRIRCIPGRS